MLCSDVLFPTNLVEKVVKTYKEAIWSLDYATGNPSTLLQYH